MITRAATAPRLLLSLLVSIGTLGVILAGCSSGSGSATTTGSQSPREEQRQELLGEIRSLRVEIQSGKVTVDWKPPQGDYVPPDPLTLLADLEASALAPDIYAYLKDSVHEATTFRAEVAKWPKVEKVTFVSPDQALDQLKKRFGDNSKNVTSLLSTSLPASLEIYLTDLSAAQEVVGALKGRPEVGEVRVGPTLDVERWLTWLRQHVHPKN